jgi:hypothetical protein
MATLTGQFIDESYKDLLQVSNSNSGIDATLRTVSDGEATNAILQLSSAQVNINQTPGDNKAAPGLSFGDANTGLYESADNILVVGINGTGRIKFDAAGGGQCFGFISGTFSCVNAVPTATAPNIAPANDDMDTGIGRAAADQLSLIAGGVEGIRIHEATSAWVVQSAPASAPADATLIASSASFYLDESGHNCMVKVKYADGTTIKTGTVCAVA